MTLVFETHPTYTLHERNYWEKYHMWERCRTDPYARWSDMKDCAIACAAAESDWARAMHKILNSRTSARYPMADCRRHVREAIVRVIDARYAPSDANIPNGDLL